MKKIFLPLLVLSLILPITPILAHGNQESKTTNVIVQDILTDQNITNQKSISCSNIDNHTFEELGDAVMSERHPDLKIHEYMDNMMGGEGSQTLKDSHIIMGKEYLGCIDDNSYSMMSDSMMNGSVMGSTSLMNDSSNLNNYDSMMNWNYSGMGAFMGVFGITAWIFLILGIIWIIKNLISVKK